MFSHFLRNPSDLVTRAFNKKVTSQLKESSFNTKEVEVELTLPKPGHTPFRKILSKPLFSNQQQSWHLIKKVWSPAIKWPQQIHWRDTAKSTQNLRKRGLCFCTTTEVSTFFVLVHYIYRCTNSSINSLCRAVSNRFFNKLKIYTNTWTVSKTLTLHQGNKIQHLHKSEIILSRDSQETIWGMNVSENILIHTTFYNTLLQLILQTLPEANTLSLLYLASDLKKKINVSCTHAKLPS